MSYATKLQGNWDSETICERASDRPSVRWLSNQVPPPPSSRLPLNRKEGYYSLCHLDVHTMPASPEWRSRQSVVRRRAKSICRGWKKRKEKNKEVC